MAELVREGAREPIVREMALPLVGGPWSSDTADLVGAIENFVRDTMTLVDEPEEFIQRPEWLLDEVRNRRQIYGDCDDATVLSLSLAATLGLPCRIVAIRPASALDYAHVFGECLVTDRGRRRTGWLRLDATIDRRRWIAGAMDRMVVEV
jgi:transglutaminase-like putative cysteine protease